MPGSSPEIHLGFAVTKGRQLCAHIGEHVARRSEMSNRSGVVRPGSVSQCCRDAAVAFSDLSQQWWSRRELFSLDKPVGIQYASGKVPMGQLRRPFIVLLR